jgi:predicted nucleotidyltransferase component of viral defense system
VQSLPLAGRLKKRSHREVAFAQDVLVAAAYDAFPDFALHGGTAIWRCYGGTRFSEDVDAYVTRYHKKTADSFLQGLASKGVRKLKFKSTRSTLFGKFELGGAVVSLEGALRSPPSRVVLPYETVSGGRMFVATLPAAELLKEKTSAYLARRKVRDLYDVFFLLSKVEDAREVANSLSKLVRSHTPPVDEVQLKSVVLEGVVPSATEMFEGISAWARRYT